MRTKKGKVLHEKGKVLPVSPSNGDGDRAYAAQLAAVLRRELSSTHTAAKTVMRWTEASERAVKTWLAGKNVPSGKHMIALMRHSDGVFALALRLSGRSSITGLDHIAVARQHVLDAYIILDVEVMRQAERTNTDHR